MRWIVGSLAGAIALLSCGDGPFAADGSCIAVVNVNGLFYTTAAGPGPSPEIVLPDPFVTITRHTGCLDQGEVADPLGPGESNFLEVGTTLHRVPSFGPTERLTYWSDVVDEWLWLALLPAEAQPR